MNVKEALLRALAETNGEYISGASLAEELGVSRNAVWKAVKSLEEEGFVIESVTAKGYRLAQNNNRLSAELIAPYLRTESLGRSMTVYESVDSTNSAAKEAASLGAPHGTAIIADTQTAGRGRLGRRFESPSGKGLYVSVVIRPEFGIETASFITSATACAAAEAVESLCGSEVRIKWVNDLYMNGKKICGILTEASLGLEMKSLDHAVIGIGINVLSGGFDDELRQIVTSIEDETGRIIDRNELCGELLNRLEAYLDKIENREFLAEYRRRELLTGNTVTASYGGGTIVGKALGVDDNANLIIELPDGEVKHIGSGEANRCRIKE